MSAGKRRRWRGKTHRIKHNRPIGWGQDFRYEPEDVTPRGKARPLGGHRLGGRDDYQSINSYMRPLGYRY